MQLSLIDRKTFVTKVLILFSTCLMTVSGIAASWVDPVTKIVWTYTISGGKASVGGGTYNVQAVDRSTTGDITIPANLGGCPVTSIGAYAFYYCRGLTGVTIPKSVTHINKYAFQNCTGLSDIVLHEGVMSVGDWIFQDCSSLSRVTILSPLINISEGMFYRCTNLKDVKLPEGIKWIKYMAFSDCTSISTLDFTSTVRGIGSAAFCGCKSLSTIKLNDGLEIIDKGAFTDCALNQVWIPVTVTNDLYGAFSHCKQLRRVDVTGGNVMFDGSFYGCTSLEVVVFHCPPRATWNEGDFFTCTNGVYTSHKEEWDRVIVDGRWKGLKMHYDPCYSKNGLMLFVE